MERKIVGRIAIVGAGVMGLCAAKALEGIHDVTVFDPGVRNASAVAGGMLAPWAEIDHLPGAFIAAGLEGIRFWENFKPGETGFARNGSLLLAHKEDTHILERFAQKLSGAGEHRRIDSDQIKGFEPSLEKFISGIYLPQEAHINPSCALKTLSRSLRIFDPRLRGDDSGEYDWIIDCRGYGAAADDPFLRGVKGEIAVVRNRDFSLSRPVRLMHPRYPLYIVPRPDHMFAIGATVIESADESVTVQSAMELLSAAYSMHPSFGEAEIVEIKAGIRPAYPDNLPRMTIRGHVIRCNGLFRHGYLLAPVMARCVADYIAGRENECMDLFLREDNEHNRQRATKGNHRRA